MDVNKLLTSAAVAGAVSALGAALNQSRQHRREREEALRTRMIEAADDLAVVAVKAAGVLSAALPVGHATFKRVEPTGEAAAVAHNDQVSRDVRVAVVSANPLIENAKARYQRITLLFGPHSVTSAKSHDMVNALIRLGIHSERLADTWDTFTSLEWFDTMREQYSHAYMKFSVARTEFVEAAHGAMKKPLDPPLRNRRDDHDGDDGDDDDHDDNDDV
jgi:hypothetical protein